MIQPPKLLIEAKFGWKKYTSGTRNVWFRGHVHSVSLPHFIDEVFAALAQGPDTTGKLIDSLNGHFSFICQGDDWTIASVDPARTYPLLWNFSPETGLKITHDGPRLAQNLNLGLADIDADMVRSFALSGFTIGDQTIFNPIKQVGPGTYLAAHKNDPPAIHRYHRWTPWQPNTDTTVDWPAKLASVNLQLIDDLISSAADRPIVVPLSAGLDSRFIVSGLVEAGYSNIHTFSYGLSGNREADVAKIIAERLDVSWTFIPYTNKDLKKMFHSNGYRAFMEYSDSLTSIHFPQEYFALTELKKADLLPSDAIMVNGQSGDFIAGNHIPASLAKPSETDTPQARMDRIIDALMAKHYKHWQNLITEDQLSIVRNFLENEIEEIGGLPTDPVGDHGIYEYCEFQDRQSKYVINGQRLYEFFDLDWRLPLWERRYLDFWQEAPLEAKLGERLYRDVLETQNWGGVWRDIPVNPTRIRPGWIRPLRAVAKALCAPFGRSSWHVFEKRYLEYFMATTSAYAAFPYAKIALDRRGHYSAIGWHIEAYLNDKGLMYDGGQRHG